MTVKSGEFATTGDGRVIAGYSNPDAEEGGFVFLCDVTDALTERINVDVIEARIDAIRDWLKDEAPYASFDQKHLDAGSPERAYWHHGYQTALADVLRMLRGGAL